MKEQLLDSITSDFTSMNETDFKRKLIKRFESANFIISLDRSIHMKALDLEEETIGEMENERLFFRRQITLKPRLRR